MMDNRHKPIINSFFIAFVTIGQGESYDVASGVGDVEDYAVGRWGGLVLRVTAKGSFYLDLDLAKVLQEDHSKGVAIDGSLDGGAFGSALDMRNFNNDIGWVSQKTNTSHATSRCQQETE